jgi:exopolysaccharide biosynthesis polyprenyl glycosylphosphotransferase
MLTDGSRKKRQHGSSHGGVAATRLGPERSAGIAQVDDMATLETVEDADGVHGSDGRPRGGDVKSDWMRRNGGQPHTGGATPDGMRRNGGQPHAGGVLGAEVGPLAPSRQLASLRIGAPLDVALLALAALLTADIERGLQLRVAVAIAALTLLLLALRGTYKADADPPVAEQLGPAVSSCAVATMSVATVAVLTGKPAPVGPFVAVWAACGAALAASRALATVGRGRARRLGHLSRRTLIVGAGRVGHLTACRLLAAPERGLQPIGFLDKEPREDVTVRADIPVLGASWDLERVIAEHNVAQVVIAFSTAPDHVLLSIARRCHAAGVAVSLVPRLFEVDLERPGATHLGALPLLRLAPPQPGSWQLHLKYALDRVFAAAALLVLAPALALIALATLAVGARPVIYRQLRAGHNGQPFWMYKFRTMIGDAVHDGEADAEWAAAAVGERAARAAPPAPARRITRVGALLRNWSLDELPQFWNVLRGEMSIIGPRPERFGYVERFSPAVYRYAERHRVKPGLTGWAQVHGLRGETSLADRVEWDNFYVENWSWGLELEILLRTLGALRTPRAPVARTPTNRRRRRRAMRRAALKVAATLLMVALTLLAVATSHAQAATTGGGTHAASVAGGPLSTDPSAVDQYVESLPTASGPVAVNTGTGALTGERGGAQGPPLAPAVLARLRAVDEPLRGRLEALATSPALGAPTRTLLRPATQTHAPGMVSAATKSVGTGPGSQLIWVLIVVGATTMLAVGAAVDGRIRRRRGGD